MVLHEAASVRAPAPVRGGQEVQFESSGIRDLLRGAPRRPRKTHAPVASRRCVAPVHPFGARGAGTPRQPRASRSMTANTEINATRGTSPRHGHTAPATPSTRPKAGAASKKLCRHKLHIE